jgi:hypothetical protein
MTQNRPSEYKESANRSCFSAQQAPARIMRVGEMITRREGLSYLLGSLCMGAMACDEKLIAAQSPKLPSANQIVGAWHYRSFVNNPQEVTDLNTILFGEGDFTLDEAPIGQLSGVGDFGGGDTVRFEGAVTHGFLTTTRFRGVGTGSLNSDWLYDYLGILVSPWPNGAGQIPTINGTVVRSAPRSNGAGGISPAGTVASFVALRR